VGVGVGVGVAIGTGFFTATPLFQINFLPDLTQVYLIPADVLVRPTFLHVVPGLTAAVAIGPSNDTVRVTVSNANTLFRIFKVWWSWVEITTKKRQKSSPAEYFHEAFALLSTVLS
jgi:hypothetical protein